MKTIIYLRKWYNDLDTSIFKTNLYLHEKTISTYLKQKLNLFETIWKNKSNLGPVWKFKSLKQNTKKEKHWILVDT